MSLINRLIGRGMTPEEEALGKLPVHQCIAAWGEYVRENPPFDDWDELCDRFGITSQEQMELMDWMVSAGQGSFSLQELEQVLELGEMGYLTENETRVRLGMDPVP